MTGISKRLECLIEMIKSRESHSLADIGCDHGFVPINLLESGIIEKAVAVDLRDGPLDRARQNARLAGASVASKIRFSKSDGLRDLRSGEADTVVITGMGGRTIVRILEEAQEEVLRSIKRFIFGPQSEQDCFRRDILDMGFNISEERLIKEGGKFYNFIEATQSTITGSKNCWSEADFIYGKILIERRDILLLEKLESDRELIMRIISSSESLPKDRLEELVSQKKLIEGVIQLYEA